MIRWSLLLAFCLALTIDAANPLTEAVRSDDMPLLRALLKAQPELLRDTHPRDNPLHEAIKANRAEMAAALLDAGAPLESANAGGETALQIAIGDERPALVTLLLERGAKTDAANKSGVDAITRAAMTGNAQLLDLVLAKAKPPFESDPLNIALILGRTNAVRRLRDAKFPEPNTIEALLAEGKKDEAFARLPKEVRDTTPLGITHLHWFSQMGQGEAIDRALAAGANINAWSPAAQTPLFTAILNDREAIAKKLLAAGAKANATRPAEVPPLLAAVSRTNAALCQLLLEAKADANATNPGSGETALLRAANLQSLAICEQLLKNGADANAADKFGNRPLLAASAGANVALLDLLLQQKPDVNATNNAGRAAIHAAVSVGSIEHARRLLAAGANPNHLTAAGTPLMVACRQNDLTMAKLLLEAKADPNLATLDGATPLGTAAFHADAELVDVIIRSGGRADDGADSPLHLSTFPFDATQTMTRVGAMGAYHRSFASLLIESPPTKVSAARRMAVTKLLLAEGYNANVTNRAGLTPLHNAAMADDVELTKLLIANKATPKLTAGDGTSPLHTAAIFNAPRCAAALIEAGAELNKEIAGGRITPLNAALIRTNVGIARLLIDKGANVAHVPAGGAPALHEIAALNDVAFLEKALAAKPDVNLRSATGWTPLSYAASKGAVESVKLLLKRGANPALADVAGFTALLTAVENGHAQVVEALIPVSNINHQSVDGRSALMLATAAPIEIFEMLMKRSPILTAKDKNQATALHFAAIEGNVEACKRLLAAGANPSAASLNGPPFSAALLGLHLNNPRVQEEIAANLASAKSPFRYNKKAKDPKAFHEILGMLMKFADVSFRGESGQALHLAAAYGTSNIVDQLLDKGADIRGRDRFGNSAMHLAALNASDPGVMGAMLRRTPGVNFQNSNAQTPLLLAIITNNLPVVKMLIGAGADVNLAGPRLVTPLHLSTVWPDTEILRLLLEKRADPKRRDLEGSTPLASACLAENLEAVKLLLPVCNPNEGDFKSTPLAAAVHRDNIEVFKLLLANGAAIKRDFGRGMNLCRFARSREIAVELVAAGLDPLESDTDGFTSFHAAIDHGCAEVAAYFLGLSKDAAELCARPVKDGRAPIHLAAMGAFDNAREKKADYEATIELLIEHGADPNLKAAGRSPLHYAAFGGNAAGIRALIRHGAKMHATDPDGGTPLHTAVHNRKREAVVALLEAGADPTLLDVVGNTPITLAKTAKFDEILSLLEGAVARKTARGLF